MEDKPKYEILYEDTCDQRIPHDCPIADEAHLATEALVDELYNRLGY